MTKEQALEKLIIISDKQELKDAIETYHELGNHIHERIDEHQKQLGEELNKFQTAKEKLKA